MLKQEMRTSEFVCECADCGDWVTNFTPIVRQADHMQVWSAWCGTCGCNTVIYEVEGMPICRQTYDYDASLERFGVSTFIDAQLNGVGRISFQNPAGSCWDYENQKWFYGCDPDEIPF